MADAATLEMRAKVQRLGSSRRAWAFYRSVRVLTRAIVLPFVSIRVEGRDRLNTPGAVLAAPVHRSHLDTVVLASLGDRRFRALAKESLFSNPVFRWVIAALGAFPTKRGEADLESMRAAIDILKNDELMFVFPEGTRQQGDRVGEMFDGVAFLAAKSGAKVLPIGMDGTEHVLGSGSSRIRRHPVAVVVGDPIDPPASPRRKELTAYTEALRVELQRLQDQAIELNRSR